VFIYSDQGFEQEIELKDHGNIASRLALCPPLEEARQYPAGGAMEHSSPELWMERVIRSRVQELFPDLRPSPIYRQVSAAAGGERGLIDLVACGYDGRLTVLELKASSDPHLPLQALDYWIRVRHHAEAGEFGERGYFPGLSISPAPPRLLLVAPAFEFHPTTETILGFFAALTDIERAGLSMNWRDDPRVVFRASRATSPGLHALFRHPGR
jgi:hypothetical protein